MPEVVYALCAVTSLTCVVLLARGYRRSGARLLLWSALCFAGFAVDNLVLILDMLVYPHIDLSMWRAGAALAGTVFLLYGMILDAE
jgi:hypothetical protein